MLRNSIRLFTIRGIEVGVHYSWLIIFFLLTWSLSSYVFPRELRGLPLVEYWLLGGISALLLFASVLIHELAHSFVALSRGLAARSITLFIFGGVSNLAGDAKRPSTEFLVAIVGPLTSFALAGLAYLVSVVVNEPRVELVADYLAFINVLLGAFNLIPGFPLDGGRVLRAILWSATGSMRRATEGAALVGRLVAYGMFAVGIWLILVDGDLISGIWLAAIAWFLHGAASTSVQQLLLEARLQRVRVSDILRPDDTTVSPATTVAELIEDYLLPRNRRAMPVAEAGRLIGIVTVSDITRVPPNERARATVGQVMGGREELVTVSPDTPARDAIELLAEHDFEQLPVTDGGRLLGLLTRADVMRQLQLRQALAPD
jgi:Zn-dependent protease/CBS domain-containing protein